MGHIRPIRPKKELVDQVNEILAQNKRILEMNEALLRAILNPPMITEAMPDMDVERLMRSRTV